MTWLNRTMLLAAVAGLLLSLAPPSALAQDDEPGWVNVRVIEVKPDRVAEWEQLHKQRNEAFKKAGRTVPEIWEVVRGNVDEYHIVTMVPKLGGNDEPQPDPLARISHRFPETGLAERAGWDFMALRRHRLSAGSP